MARGDTTRWTSSASGPSTPWAFAWRAMDAFSEEDDRVLTELARQVGLAMHNARLDTELQTTLDELRKQADELRQSRARIVASGDAERRRR